MLASCVPMEISWITPKWPLPAVDGARIATTQLLKNLSSRKMKIHLYAIIPNGESVDVEAAKNELGVDAITVIHREPSGRLQKFISALRKPLTPVTLSTYASRSIAKSLTAHLSNKNPELLVYDGLHAAAWSFTRDAQASLRCAQAYRAHNVESDIWYGAAKQSHNPLKKLVLLLQGYLVKFMETRLVKRADFIFPVSRTDARKFRTYETTAVIHSLPIGLQSLVGNVPRVTAGEDQRNLLFVGRLDWPPNREGLAWILVNVWPPLMKITDDLTLTIVGSGNSAWLEQFRGLYGIKIVGQVDNLAPYYENCIATIVPVFYGSGTRVKAIESSLHARVCISTKLGVEGIGLVAGKTYLNAETATDWIQTLATLNTSFAMAAGKRAMEQTKTAFDSGQISESFIHCVSRNR